MINAAICNDDPVIKRIFTSILTKINSSYSYRINIIDFSEPSDEDSTDYPELLIIDDKYQKDGFKAAKHFREKGCLSEIIFLLSVPDNFILTFDFSPSACLIKPVLYEDFENAITDVLSHMISSEKIYFRTNHSARSVMADDIIYIEAEGRYTNVRTLSDIFECTESISAVLERLSEFQFFRTHRTYILNMKHISDIQENLIYMSNGEIAVLSRNRKKDFDLALKRYRNKYLHK